MLLAARPVRNWAPRWASRVAARRTIAQVARARLTSDWLSLRWRQSWRRKTHAHAATTAATAAGRCLHASTSPLPPPPIPRLVGKYPHTLRSNQSALACPRGCSHGLGGILSPSLSRFARLYPLLCRFLSCSSPSLFLCLALSLPLYLSVTLSFTWLSIRAVRYTARTRVIPNASREILDADTAATVEVRSRDLSVVVAGHGAADLNFRTLLPAPCYDGPAGCRTLNRARTTIGRSGTIPSGGDRRLSTGRLRGFCDRRRRPRLTAAARACRLGGATLGRRAFFETSGTFERMVRRELLPPSSSPPLLLLLLLKLLHSRLVDTRSDGDKQRALWGSVNVLGQPRAAASRAPVSQCTRGKRTRIGDQYVIFAYESATRITLAFACQLAVELSSCRAASRRVRIRRFDIRAYENVVVWSC